MFHITELTDHSLLSFLPLLLIHRGQSSTDNIGDLGHEALVDPKEVVGVIASETNQLENMVNGFGCHAGEEPELNVPKIGLQNTNDNPKCIKDFKSIALVFGLL